MLSHRNLAVNVEQLAIALRTRRGARTLAFLPYFHVYGMTVLMNLYLSRGGLQVTMPCFDLEGALRLIEAHRITDLFVAPPVVLAFAKSPLVERFDISSLEFVMCGGAPLGEDMARACAERIGAEVFQGYGMTEMSPVSHISPSGLGRPASLARWSRTRSAEWSTPRPARTWPPARQASFGCAARR
jgi:acyl-CoA synthetase (AMP-forming)/AMP-acid ligase II